VTSNPPGPEARTRHPPLTSGNPLRTQAITDFAGALRRYTLPAGWSPATWNTTGTQLLAWGPGSDQIGLWSPARPHSIEVIGSLPKGVTIGEFAWLAKPAKI